PPDPRRGCRGDHARGAERPLGRLRIGLLAATEAPATLASHWLARFERALAARDEALLKDLFHADSHWRDVLAFSWRIQTVSGGAAIAAALKGANAQGFRLDPCRSAPRHATRAGEKCIEA